WSVSSKGAGGGSGSGSAKPLRAPMGGALGDPVCAGSGGRGSGGCNAAAAGASKKRRAADVFPSGSPGVEARPASCPRSGSNKSAALGALCHPPSSVSRACSTSSTGSNSSSGSSSGGGGSASGAVGPGASYRERIFSGRGSSSVAHGGGVTQAGAGVERQVGGLSLGAGGARLVLPALRSDGGGVGDITRRTSGLAGVREKGVAAGRRVNPGRQEGGLSWKGPGGWGAQELGTHGSKADHHPAIGTLQRAKEAGQRAQAERLFAPLAPMGAGRRRGTADLTISNWPPPRDSVSVDAALGSGAVSGSGG
ncbi:unnamed protein product, partial [Scytosiphon promiscuus]